MISDYLLSAQHFTKAGYDPLRLEVGYTPIGLKRDQIVDVV